MNIKNYTSEMPVSTSMTKIEKFLVSAGATNISKSYDGGLCKAVTFRLMVNQTPLFFQLPAKVDGCFEAMWKEVSRPRKDTRQRLKQQAERTAWKIVCDWVEVQLTMIKLEQAEALQVFLPYVYDPRTEQTFYDKIKGGNLKLLTN